MNSEALTTKDCAQMCLNRVAARANELGKGMGLGVGGGGRKCLGAIGSR